MARDPKDDPYYNPDFSPEVNEVTNDFTYKKFAEKQITGDAVIIRKRDNLGDFDVLLIKRKRGPHQGGFALPGGIYEEGMDTLEDFIGREALEEVGLQESDIVNSFDLEPKLDRFDWDARASKGVDVYAKVFIVDGDFVPLAADDALSAQFINIDDIVSGKVDLAFGHAEWISDSYGRGKAAEATVGKGRDDLMKLRQIVKDNKKRNQDFILEVNKKRQFDNFNIIDLTLDSEFDMNAPDNVGDLFRNDPQAQQTGAMDALSAALPDNLDETDLSDEDKKMIEQYREDKAEFDRLVKEGETEITDDDIADLGLEENDLADGDAMTEQFLDQGDEIDELDLARELGIVEEGPMDTSNLSNDAKDKLDNLADDETKAQFYDMEDIENYANGKTKITAEQAQELQQMTGMFTDKADEIVNKLPLEDTVRNKLSKKLSQMSVRWTTFSGAGELLDIYETAVLLFYGMAAAKPELEKIATNYMIDMYNVMAEPYGAKINRDEYTPDWKNINEQLEKAEKITPTDIIIKKTGELIEDVAETGMVTGFGYVPTTADKLTKTIKFPSPEEEKVEDPMYDRIRRTFSGKFTN